MISSGRIRSGGRKSEVPTPSHLPRKTESDHPNCLRLNPPRQKQDQHNDNHQSQSATGVVSPAPALRPGRQSPEQQKNQNHQHDPPPPYPSLPLHHSTISHSAHLTSP